MSLSLAESTLVLAKIRVHHGNATITELEAKTFHEELRKDATLADSMEAVKRFYTDNTSGRWMGSGDVNVGIKVLRKSRIPSEAEIGRLVDQASIDDQHYLAYRRQLIQSISQGQAVQQAHALAVKAAHQIVIEAAKPKLKRKPGHHFAGHGQAKLGSMSINNILGKETE